ncbi:hypothetical protein T4E_8963 [Trichinella pseudospiralis]|uniref:Uncharacterized protein n=1 Tax=Trichinella pseudospiralis TaxID=6337 RepID=A0A0V0YGK5_TRIPS|nr:hypothetical protein T4E_8963 [Trichinella pseudospiralis]
MEAYAVPKCSAISGQLAANVGVSTPIFSKFYANFYRITLAYSDRPACGDVGSIGAFDSYLRICLVILFLYWGCGHHRPLFSWLAHLSLYSHLLAVFVAIPTRLLFVVVLSSCWLSCLAGTLIFFFCLHVSNLISMFVALVPVTSVSECGPRHLLFSNNLLLDGVNEAARSDVIAHLMERRIASMLV